MSMQIDRGNLHLHEASISTIEQLFYILVRVHTHTPLNKFLFQVAAPLGPVMVRWSVPPLPLLPRLTLALSESNVCQL